MLDLNGKTTFKQKMCLVAIKLPHEFRANWLKEGFHVNWINCQVMTSKPIIN